MKLLTLNVHSWLEENQEQKLEELAKSIAKESYDVIALQEVNQLMISPVVYDDIREDNYGYILLGLIEKYTEIPYYYHWSISHIGYHKYEEGVAILTKHPILDVDEFFCTRLQSVRMVPSRKIVSINLEINGKVVEFYSCHMNLPNDLQEKMVDNIKTILKRSENDNLKVLMGDFNTDYNSKLEYMNILNEGLYDTYTMAKMKDDGITVNKVIDGWPGNFSNKKLDYIFTNKEVKVEYSKVVFNGKNYPIVSDHFGLEVLIDL